MYNIMGKVLSFFEKDTGADSKQTSVQKVDKPTIRIDLVRNFTDLNTAFELRYQVFVREKGVSENAEFDGNDFVASHVLLKVNDIPAATLRIRCFSQFAKVERVCVAKAFRNQRLWQPLLNYTEEYLKSKGYDCFVGYILKELSGFWFEHGFKPNPNMQEVKKDCMILVPVVYPFKKQPVSRARHHQIDLLAREGTTKVME